MRNSRVKIVLTPIEELFDEKELLDMFMKIKPRLHCCYYHSCMFAHYMKAKYPSIEYHEGVYEIGLYVHAWNSIVKEGVKYYFDFTGYFLEKKFRIPRASNALLLRTYSPKEIYKYFFEKGQWGCTIDIDGTYDRYIEKYHKEEKEKKDREIHFETITLENEAKKFVPITCISY